MDPIAQRSRWLLLVVVFVAASACSTPVATPPPVPSSASPRPAGSGSSVEPSASVVTPVPSVTPIRIDPSDARWTGAIDEVIDRANVSVAIGAGDHLSYVHLGGRPRIPASTQKLVTSMVALDTWGPAHRFRTSAVSRRVRDDGVVPGDLWIVGSGDPGVDAASMSRLASRIDEASIERIGGSVVGDTSAFTREWWAPGWVPGLSRNYVNRPTALTFDGNAGRGLPERRAAASLTAALEVRGIDVNGPPMAAPASNPAVVITGIRSAPLADLLTIQNHGSVNFIAETLLKALGATGPTRQGSTAAGAAVVGSWVAEHGGRAEVLDGSGLSHSDHIAARDLTGLLLLAADAPWGDALRTSLPRPAEGTISARLAGVDVHAKTGTLFVTPVSALAGYVTDRSGASVAFSIISRGLSKATAIGIEDTIVRIVAGASIG